MRIDQFARIARRNVSCIHLLVAASFQLLLQYVQR